MSKNGPATILDLSQTLKDKKFIVVGDIHGCYDEFLELLAKANIEIGKDFVICVGDLIDRGPKSPQVVKFFMDTPNVYTTIGNHDERFLRYLKGNPIEITHGLEKTLAQFEENYIDPKKMLDYFSSLPYIIKIPDGYIVHAGFHPGMMPELQIKLDCLYMRYVGGKDYFDESGDYWFERLPDDYPNTFSGHQVHEYTFHQRFSYHTYPESDLFDYECPFESGMDYLLDGGCVFGGELRGYIGNGFVLTVKPKQAYSEHNNDAKAKLENSKKHFYDNTLDK